MLGVYIIMAEIKLGSCKCLSRDMTFEIWGGLLSAILKMNIGYTPRILPGKYMIYYIQEWVM